MYTAAFLYLKHARETKLIPYDESSRYKAINYWRRKSKVNRSQFKVANDRDSRIYCTNLFINPAVNNVGIPVKFVKRKCIQKFMSAVGCLQPQVFVASIHTAKKNQRFNLRQIGFRPEIEHVN